MTAPSWDARRDLPWAKVHTRWYTSPSHLHLSAATLAVGIAAMLIANQRGRGPDGSGWCLTPSGDPMPVDGLAWFAHASPNEAGRAIRELIDAGTMVRREDGAVGFPRLQHWQEDPSTRRKRAARKGGSDA